MGARAVPLIVGLGPLIVTSVSYWLASAAGTVPSCLPSIDGCTSISATGRQPPSSFLFKGTMLPVAMLVIVYWRLCAGWLEALGVGRTRSHALFVIGGIGGLFLILYLTFLGSEGAFYNLMRRYGVTVFFGFNYLAQLLLAERILHLARRIETPVALRRVGQVKLAICVVMMGVGLASIPVMNFVAHKDEIQNVIEWNFGLLMFTNFALTWVAWRATNFQVRLTVRSLSG